MILLGKKPKKMTSKVNHRAAASAQPGNAEHNTNLQWSYTVFSEYVELAGAVARSSMAEYLSLVFIRHH